MILSFKNFELTVIHLSSIEDFKENKEKLKGLRISDYETFINFLKLGGEITQSIAACDEVFKVCREFSINEVDFINIFAGSFNKVNYLISQKYYTK